MSAAGPVIALLTDFGQKDYFVASMKGVIININPNVLIIDITHEARSYDILEAGFMLNACCGFFPQGTIFVSVVDPGVGSSRRILLAGTADHYFIAPDNGLLSLVLNKEKYTFLKEVQNPKYFLSSISKTFEARDKMAPAAAWLSLGKSPDEFGPEVQDYISLDIPQPKVEQNRIKGTVLYKDKFGNLITNIEFSLFKNFAAHAGGHEKVLMQIRKRKIPYSDRYSDRRIGEEMFLAGSLGLIEIAVREGSASEKLKIEPGESVTISALENKKKEY